MRSSFPHRAPPEAIEAPPRNAPMTTALVLINVAIFLLEEQWGGSTTSQTLLRMGATLGGEGVQISRAATLFSYGYLHIGAFHLGMNMFALWSIGRVLEPAMGTSRFFVLYTLSLIGGGLAIAQGGPILTAGASGALFGLLGAVAMRMFARYRTSRAVDERREIRGHLGRLLIPNLVISFLPGVSLLGHAGGLVVGALFVTVAWRRDQRPTDAHPLMTAAAVLLALATAAAIAWVWLTMEPWRLG